MTTNNNNVITKYDWSKVPELILWIATDEDGLTFGYPNQPYQETFLGRGRWNNDRFIPLFMSKFQFLGDWTQSLEQRPRDITDSCADIRNHVSPSTIVKDLEAERHG